MFDLGSDVTVIGAGPVGLLSAMLLAHRGYRVHVFDTRPDPRNASKRRSGRSISFTLTKRGWKALSRAGIEPLVRELATPLRGRMIHLERDAPRFQAYGANAEAIDAVSRREVMVALTERAEQTRGITLHFEHRCRHVDPDSGVLTFDCSESETFRVRAARIIAADGANSSVRLGLANRPEFSFERSYSRHFYREFHVPALPGGDWVFEPDALHVWPREEHMLVAFPQPEGTFTATLFMPLDGFRSFNSLATPADLLRVFTTEFNDIMPYMPNLVSDFYSGAPAQLITLKCFPWTFGGTTALIGDAAHAMFPFLGQGLNAGLEDVVTLIERLEATGDDWPNAIAQYQSLRKPDCDAVTELAANHFSELAQNTRDPDFVLRKRVESKLAALLPAQFISPYHIVSFSDRPYREVQTIAELQRKVVDRLMLLSDIDARCETPQFDDEIRSVALATLDAERTILNNEVRNASVRPPSIRPPSMRPMHM